MNKDCAMTISPTHAGPTTRIFSWLFFSVISKLMPSVYVVWGNAQNFFDGREYLQLFFVPHIKQPTLKALQFQ